MEIEAASSLIETPRSVRFCRNGRNQRFANHPRALPGALTNLKTVAVKVAIEQSPGGEV
jgi:hypothetical protein